MPYLSIRHNNDSFLKCIIAETFYSYLVVFLEMLDSGKVDLIMNCVERPSGGFSAGGGISSGYV